jgi:hypothetical protein
MKMKLFATFVWAPVVHQVAASFHVAVVKPPGNAPHTFVACPSNYFNCECLVGGNHAEPVEYVIGTEELFAVHAGLCEKGQMNIYLRASGAWALYDNDSGAQLGWCHDALGTLGCWSYGNYVEIEDNLICSTSLVC